MSEKQIKIFSFYLITFLVYTQGFWERFTSLPAQNLLEMVIWLVALFSFRPKYNRSFLLFGILVFVGIIISILTSLLIPYLKYIRFLLYFYILFDVFSNIKFSIPQFNRYFVFFIFMILLQGVASVYHIFILGVRVEGHVGFMSSLGGTTATIFPLLVISVLITIFYFWRSRKYLIYFILLFISVILVGYSSGKRAIFFAIPTFVFAISLIAYYFYPSKVKNIYFKKLFLIAIIIIFCVPIYFFGMKTSGGFNYGLTGNESNIELLQHSLEYAEEYESRERGKASAGRSGTTRLILLRVANDPSFLMHGAGFASVKDKETMDDLGFVYGVVGFTRDIISGGLIFAILTVLFFISIIFEREYEENDFIAKFMRWVVFAVFVFTHFGYSSDFFVHLKINMMMIPLLALLNCEKYREIKRYYYQKYFKLNYVKNS